MKKRVVALLLTAAMTMSLLAGCGGKKDWEDGDGKIDGEILPSGHRTQKRGKPTSDLPSRRLRRNTRM